MSEKVLVFNTVLMEKFKNLPRFSGLKDDIQHLKYDCIPEAYFEDRKLAESNEDQKQIIPYTVIRKGDQVLAYMRSKKSGESRLHNKWSVGVGGHINPEDANKTIDPNLVISRAIQRELMEELDWGDLINCTVNNISEFGIIYDNDNPVGRVHIGLIMVIDIPKDKITDSDYPMPREDTFADCQWFTLEEASKLRNLEGWSTIVLEAMMSGYD